MTYLFQILEFYSQFLNFFVKDNLSRRWRFLLFFFVKNWARFPSVSQADSIWKRFCWKKFLTNVAFVNLFFTRNASGLNNYKNGWYPSLSHVFNQFAVCNANFVFQSTHSFFENILLNEKKFWTKKFEAIKLLYV